MLGLHQHCFTTVAGGDLWNSALTPPATPTSPTPSSHATCLFRPSEKRSPEQRPESTLDVERPAQSETASGWSLRSRRHRLSTARPVKRLFTPDIKKMLKGWLVRRRDNPYPSRAEKEALATRTGLTYMQVCNWFANWRRKLRDCARPEDGDDEDGGEGDSTSWAHLIRRYNAMAAADDAANGQEHFSISSSDSIWTADRAAVVPPAAASPASPQQNAHVSSTTTDAEATKTPKRAECGGGSAGWALSLSARAVPAVPDEREPSAIRPECSRQVTHVLGDAGSALDSALCTASSARSGSALLLSKWLESAARYQPSAPPVNAKHSQKLPSGWGIASAAVEHTLEGSLGGRRPGHAGHALEGRHREELDAAEALAFLSSLHFR